MKRKLLLMKISFFLCSILFAEEFSTVNKLNLEKAIECALENNNSIKQEKITLEQTKRTYSHSWNNFLPSVSASASAQENGEFSSDSKNSVINAGINANISFSAGLGTKLSTIKKNYENGLMNFEDSLREIKTSVTKSFYSILYLKKNVELNEELLKTNQEQYEQTKIKKSKGMVPELELLQSQLNVETAKVNLKNAQKNYYNNFLTFLNDIGFEMNPKEKIELEGSLEDCVHYKDFSIDLFDSVNLEKLDSYVENSPSVRSAKNEVEIEELNLKKTKLDTNLPSLNLSANVNPYKNTFNSTADSWTKSDSWSASIGLSFNLDNLVPGSSSQDSIKNQEDSVKTKKIQLDEKRKSTKTQVLESLHTIEIAKETLENYEQNVELAKKTYELSLIAYKNGTKEFSDLKTVQNSYSDAKVQLSNQQLSLISSVIELKNLLGIDD